MSKLQTQKDLVGKTILTNSLAFAKRFDINHKHLLEKIRKLDDGIISSNFIKDTFLNSRGRVYPMYNITDFGVDYLIYTMGKPKTPDLVYIRDEYIKIRISTNSIATAYEHIKYIDIPDFNLDDLIYTYFIQDIDNDSVKIGRTVNVKSRLQVLNNASSTRLDLILYLHGEWFKYDVLLDFIRNYSQSFIKLDKLTYYS